MAKLTYEELSKGKINHLQHLHTAKFWDSYKQDEDEKIKYQNIRYYRNNVKTFCQTTSAIKNKKNTVHETADVIYHLLVTLESAGINFNDIIKELKKREDTSGFVEKKNR